MGRLRATPIALRILLAVSLVSAAAWICALPPWQGPDEARHFAYVQRIADAHEIPWSPHGDSAPGQRQYSTELSRAYLWSGLSASLTNPGAKPAWNELDVEAWNRIEGRLPDAARRDGGRNSAMRNPPLYYAYAAIPYEVTSSASIFTREFAIRLFNVPFLLAVVALTWLLAGELFGGDRWRQTVATAAVAVQPMLLHMTAVTGPDLLLAALGALVLYLSVLVVRRGPSRSLVAGLAAAVAAAALTHGRGIALAAPAIAALAIGWYRGREPARRPSPRAALAAGLVACGGALLALWWYATSGLGPDRVREYASYLWQFYLPRLPFMSKPPGPPWDVKDVFVDRFFGGFAGLEVTFSDGVYTAIAVASLIVVAVLVAGLIARWDAVRREWPALAVLVTGAVSMMLLLHAEGFRSVASGSPDPVITGRYLLPLITLFGAGIAAATGWLPRTAARVSGAVAVSLVLVVQIAALGLVVTRFGV